MRPLFYGLLLVPLGLACGSAEPDGAVIGDYGQTRTGGASAGNGSQSGAQGTSSGSSAGSAWDGGTTPVPVKPPPSQPVEDAGAPVVVPWDAGATSEAGVSGASVLNECVGAINALRGQNDLEAYEVSTDLEAFAASAAAADAASGEEDGYFDGSQQSVSFGEDELLGSQLDPTGSALQVLEAGLAFEQQGFIHGDRNLLSEQFSQVGCGVAQALDGTWWVAIEYR